MYDRIRILFDSISDDCKVIFVLEGSDRANLENAKTAIDNFGLRSHLVCKPIFVSVKTCESIDYLIQHIFLVLKRNLNLNLNL